MTNEQIVARIQAGENVAENMKALYLQVKGFIHGIALRYQGQAELDDLEQEGFLALYAAVDGYDQGTGCLFLTYARHWIRQAMIRYIQNNGSIRIPVHEWERVSQYKKLESAFLLQLGRKPSEAEIGHYLGLTHKQAGSLKNTLRMWQIGSLVSPLTGRDGEEDGTMEDTVAGPDSVEDAVVEAVQASELRTVIWETVDSLPGDQPEVLRGRYREGRSLRSVGAGLGVSIERVRQIEQRALRELRKPSRSRRLMPFLPDDMAAQAYRHNGAGEFRRTWTSSTEWVALRL